MTAPSLEVPTELFARIQKLFDKATSAQAIGSLEEADAFMAKVNELLLRHHLDMDSVSAAVRDQADPIGQEVVEPEGLIKFRRTMWTEELAYAVAEAHYCRVLIHNAANIVWVVGRATDRQICAFMIEKLTRLGRQLGDQAYRDERNRVWRESGGRHVHTAGFRQAWFAGFTYTIRRRYQDLMAQNRAQNKGYGLILVKAEQEVQEWIAAQGITEAKDPTWLIEPNVHAVRLGAEAASKVSLTPDALGGDGKTAKRLG